MAHNFLHLNQDKTKVLIVGAKAQRESSHTFYFTGSKDKTPGKKQGVILDSEQKF
jgi:hypothetical protein